MSRLDGISLEIGWMKAMNVRVEAATREGVSLKMTVGEEHLQPAGLVHGGVFSGLIETACSIGALCAAPEGHAVVGAENQSSFLRPVTSGTLTTQARSLYAGKRSQLWTADVLDAEGRLVASGRVRLFCIPPSGQ
ncbi:MAG: hypothetical protein RJA70_4564 [Pseudomonadota bacterium]|jgi:uncharacterized protein (TIGR00369 family)